MRTLTPILLALLAGCPGPRETGESDSPPPDSQPPDSPPGETGLDAPSACSLRLSDPDPVAPPTWRLEHEEGTRDPDEILVSISWYGGLVSLALELGAQLDEGALPFLPHAIEEHDLQQAWLAREGSLLVEVAVEARWSEGTSCRDHAQLPFRSWEQPETIRLATGLEVDPSQLNQQRSQQLADTFGLVVMVEGQLDEDYQHEVQLVLPVTGDLLQRWVVDRTLMEEVAIGVFNGGQLASADIQRGALTLMSEGSAALVEAQLYRYHTATGERLASYDMSEWAEREGPLYAHNRMFLDPRDPDLLHTVLWQPRQAEDPPGAGYISPAARIRLAEDLSIEQVVVWADPAAISLNEELYGNAISLSPAGHDGERYECVTYPADYNAKKAPQHASAFIVAARRTQEQPELVFVREGFTDISINPAIAERYPDARVIEVPDLADGPTMDFLHGAELVSTAEGRFELWLLSLHRAGMARLSRFDLDLDSAVLTPVCAHQPERDPTSYSSILMTEDSELVSVFWGDSANVDWIDRQTCALVARQRIEDESVGYRAKPRWMEAVRAADFVDGEHIEAMSLSFELGLGEGLFGEI